MLEFRDKVVRLGMVIHQACSKSYNENMSRRLRLSPLEVEPYMPVFTFAFIPKPLTSVRNPTCTKAIVWEDDHYLALT